MVVRGRLSGLGALLGALVEVWAVAAGPAQGGLPAEGSAASAAADSQATVAADSCWGEFQEVAAELQAGGAPLTLAEQEVLLAGSAGVPPANARGSTGLGGRLQWRDGWREGRRDPATVALAARAPWGELKVRRGRQDRQPEPWRGAARVQAGGWALLVGGCGLTHGFGLLAGSPGRSGSLGADRGLGPDRPGWRLWPYEPGSGAWTGAGAQGRWGRATVQVLAGEGRATEGGPGGGRCLGRVSLAAGPQEGHLAAAGLWEAGRRSLSLSGGYRRDKWLLDAEACAGEGSGQVGRARAWVLSGRWLGAAWGTVEGVVGWSEGGPSTGSAVLPAVLSGWEGRGWALRAHLRAAPVTVDLLTAAASDLEPGAVWERQERRITEIQGSWQARPRWRWEGRWRRQVDAGRCWSARFPWEPAVAGPWQERDLLSLGLTHRDRGGGFRVAYRILALRDGLGGGGTRRLLGLGWVGSPHPRWEVRAQWCAAWGDGIDLVSAVSPLPGYVVTRHWGRWTGEMIAGAACTAGSLRWHGAVSRRQPTPAGGESPRWEGWLGGTWVF